MKRYPPLERAITYIEAHLNEYIGLNEVSRETGYSYYYMTRLFSSVLGESVGHYIDRRRLYNASEKLIHSDQKVIDIALDCGYESSEAFSRAFKAVFGYSPVAYRKAGLDLVIKAKKELAPEDVCHIANHISHAPKIILLGETEVAGLRGTTSLSDNQLPGLWEQFHGLNKDFFTTSAGYGICETQKTAYTKDGDALYSVMISGPVKDFDCLPLELEKRRCVQEDTLFSPTGAHLETYIKHISISSEHGCRPQGKNWMTGKILKFMSMKFYPLMIQIMKLKFLFLSNDRTPFCARALTVFYISPGI